MRRFLAILFGVLLVVSLGIWIIGTLTAAVVPWFGGHTAERIGQVGVVIFIFGEGVIFLFGWLFKRFSEQPKRRALGCPGPRRYGNKRQSAYPEAARVHDENESRTP